MRSLLIGVDLGQVSDYTAIAVIEETDERVYHVRHLERMLNTPYPTIVERLKKLASSLPEPASLAVDATGVGRPVVDMIRYADIPGDLYPITLTGGSTVTWGDMLERRVPKRDVASAIAVLLQTARLKVASQIPDAAVLLHELMNFRVKINVNANETYEAWRESDHDDLVLAVGLACWLNEKGIDGWLGLARDHAKQSRAEDGWFDPRTHRLPPSDRS